MALDKNLTLYYYYVFKEERKFTNYVLAWTYNKKKFFLSVKPAFVKDYKLMCGVAHHVKDFESIKSMIKN